MLLFWTLAFDGEEARDEPADLKAQEKYCWKAFIKRPAGGDGWFMGKIQTESFMIHIGKLHNDCGENNDRST